MQSQDRGKRPLEQTSGSFDTTKRIKLITPLPESRIQQQEKLAEAQQEIKEKGSIADRDKIMRLVSDVANKNLQMADDKGKSKMDPIAEEALDLRKKWQGIKQSLQEKQEMAKLLGSKLQDILDKQSKLANTGVDKLVEEHQAAKKMYNELSMITEDIVMVKKIIKNSLAAKIALAVINGERKANIDGPKTVTPELRYDILKRVKYSINKLIDAINHGKEIKIEEFTKENKEELINSLSWILNVEK